MADIAIVGAGVAGLAAGQVLQQAGYSVTVFEKSRGPGGRVASCTVGLFRVDHGAQVVKAPTAELLSLVQAVGGAEDLTAPVWTFDGQGRVTPGDPAMNAEPKWVWPGGNSALAKYLARGLPLRTEVTIASLRRVGAGYDLVESSGGAFGPYQAVLLTPPAPQVAHMLATSAVEPAVKRELLAALAPASYRMCLSIALAYPQRPQKPWYALINTDRQHAIAWLACEHSKPGRAPAANGLILAQMGPAWSAAYWDALMKGQYGEEEELPTPLAQVHAMVCGFIGTNLGAPLWVDVHRWRYALASTPYLAAASAGRAGIYVAGDGEQGLGRVHLAIESGWRAAQRIISRM
ncbi:NAD(P)/FAD-dependent oxidoreductase [Candidatus Chloroploca sp. Khr17]|uniref:NAD(P)/FAD-dependent oxidoreductase n=1 Tax=Candidatus Chloroploca sp. Khr17 TaxID=2496869 RepID=UPI00101D45C8|nr:FAD-dependent oxidoreductase [Candidatus Chloroploca sp. Khr17]